ncbi:hypothetical protein [Aneurinibacillus tyrosinisolvens]|uniref:hypothetical protein n=1 Tax=Aneurinibacillus tyrosinisolvens TaxID=1443435 RepID=UPI000B058995|nr:hypothetical protein [Aneurinibacillus tyrosinisolvens]
MEKNRIRVYAFMFAMFLGLCGLLSCVYFAGQFLERDNSVMVFREMMAGRN